MAEFRFIGDPRANGHGPATLELFGLTFGRDEWTPVAGDLAERLEGHSHLERRQEAKRAAAPAHEPAEGDDLVFDRGAKAKADGKKRSVPPAYRGKPEEARWLAGYDEA